MLDFDIKWTLVGHSERRKFNDETNSVVALKTDRAIKHGINVVLCIGETNEEREEGKTFDILSH